MDTIMYSDLATEGTMTNLQNSKKIHIKCKPWHHGFWKILIIKKCNAKKLKTNHTSQSYEAKCLITLTNWRTDIKNLKSYPIRLYQIYFAYRSSLHRKLLLHLLLILSFCVGKECYNISLRTFETDPTLFVSNLKFPATLIEASFVV